MTFCLHMNTIFVVVMKWKAKKKLIGSEDNRNKKKRKTVC